MWGVDAPPRGLKLWLLDHHYTFYIHSFGISSLSILGHGLGFGFFWGRGDCSHTSLPSIFLLVFYHHRVLSLAFAASFQARVSLSSMGYSGSFAQHYYLYYPSLPIPLLYFIHLLSLHNIFGIFFWDSSIIVFVVLPVV